MTIYQVSTVFKDEMRYPAVEADSEQDARARAQYAFDPDPEFLYIESAVALDCFLTKEEFPYPTPTSTSPSPSPPSPGAILTLIVTLSKDEIASIHRALNCQYYYLEQSLRASSLEDSCCSFKAELAAIVKLRDALFAL